MIGHDNPSVEVIKTPFGLSLLDRLSHKIGDAGVFQPQRATRVAIQRSIVRNECPARRLTTCFRSQGQTSPEAPGEKNVYLIGLPVRQSSTIDEH
jgi:hypothetical protein